VFVLPQPTAIGGLSTQSLLLTGVHPMHRCIVVHHLPLLAACDLHARLVQLVAGWQRLHTDHAGDLRRLAWRSVRHSSGEVGGAGCIVHELMT
jgi:hypothetical protein